MKKLCALIFPLLCSAVLLAQKAPGWHLKDKAKDGIQGISLNEAYQFLQSKKLKSTTTIVAVLDSGIDTLHEDLTAIRWTNAKELAGNNVDDDINGYVDDVHGWNFLGGKTGNITVDSDEKSRFYHAYKSKYDGITIDESKLSKEALYEYKTWQRAKADMFADNGVDVAILQRFLKSMKEANEKLIVAIGKAEYTGNELDAFIPSNDSDKKAKAMLLGLMKSNGNLEVKNTIFIKEGEEYINGEVRKDEAKTKAPQNYKKDVAGDDELNWNDKSYGNNNLMVEKDNAKHGTHVTGIIAADRKNKVGIMGVADNVKVITLRTVPDGDEHDKDIAYAIRYAVDNGAKVVNMSFGKSYSPQKKWVDDAVEYAQKKGVLLIHAAGNDGKNLDDNTSYNFPNARLLNGKVATNWIEVGASSDPKLGVDYMTTEGTMEKEGFAASFSNYGKKNVDVFAPGVVIYSTVPGGNTYEDLQGTSMASPVVAGLAALIKSYFPKLTPEQIKKVLETSSVKITAKTAKPGSVEKVPFNTLSKTGGIVNALQAVKLAYTMSGGK